MVIIFVIFARLTGSQINNYNILKSCYFGIKSKNSVRQGSRSLLDFWPTVSCRIAKEEPTMDKFHVVGVLAEN